jgi:riboflavin kinase/FMN adenylyltransferase
MSCRTVDYRETPPDDYRGGAVSIGNFDGVHRGHAALLAELRRQAEAVGGPAVAVTFDPPPLRLLQPAKYQPALTTLETRAALLEARGADQVLILRTTHDLLHLSADDFFQQVIRAHLSARALVEGDNFRFGHNREGTIDTLRTLCRQAGLGLSIVPPLVTPDGTPISSSRVRDALLRGDVREAAELLDRPYRLRGLVATGQRRGQTLGFPTANLEKIVTLIPSDGVYAVRAFVDGQTWPGAANIGPNPTFGEQARKVEVHLIDYQGNLYGRELEVEFLERLRDTRPFAGVTQLVEQLRHDIDQARRIAGRTP